MEIVQNKEPGKTRFEIKEKDEVLGEMVYRMEDEKNMVIEHTFIDPSLRGKDFGKQLLDEIANYARSKQLHVSSECSYASKLLEKNKETFKDII